MEENNIDKVQDTPNPQAGVEQNPAIAPIPPQPTEMVKPPEIIKPKKNFKTLLLIILVLFLLAASGYFVYSQGYLNKLIATPTPQPTATSIPSPSPNPTADWKTYTNTTYKFSLKYPADWLKTEQNEINLRKISDETPATSGISLILGKGDLLISQICKTATASNPEPQGYLCSSNITPTKKVINGIEWERLNKDQVSFPPTGYVIYNLSRNGQLYVIYNWGYYEESEIDQILSTFKFTESDETAGWKVYNFDAYKFSLKYPPSWFVNNCNYDHVLLLNPAAKPVCETEPYDPIMLNVFADTIKDHIKMWEEGNAYSYKKVDKQNLPAGSEWYSLTKDGPNAGPGPYKIVTIFTPLSNKALLQTQMNDPSYEETAIQMLSTLKID